MAAPTATLPPGALLRPALRDLTLPHVTAPVQLSFDELDDPLRDTTFVVLDLETTGGSAEHDEITEIGAVKVRGGEVLAEFGTLVDPGRSIPPQITILTGITDAMVVSAPRLSAVLPSLLEFLRGAVLVAHNARFDVGFLRAACTARGMAWPSPPVLDTVPLARRVFSAQEAPSLKLGALARLVGASTTPDHRALHDARATVDVLHAIFERIGNLGVQSLSELQRLSRDLRPELHRRRHLAASLPQAPGVYLFRGPSDEVLYVGTSRNLRRRVRSYFGATDQRPRIREMVALATRVDHVTCAHALEAQVREQRLIAAHRPPYNRRSAQPSKIWWVVLTAETFPRLSVVARAPDGTALGPFRRRAEAMQAVEALQEVTRLRRCTQRLARRPTGTACTLADLGHCDAPCTGAQSPADYAVAVRQVAELVDGVSDELLTALRERIEKYSRAGRFDRAGVARDRLSVLAQALDRGQRLRGVTAVAELAAARPDGTGGWELSVIRHGRLAGAAAAVRGVDPRPVLDLIRRSAETVIPEPGPLPCASAEETATVLRWLETPGTRLVDISDVWACPVGGAGRWRPFVQAASLATESLRKDLWR